MRCAILMILIARVYVLPVILEPAPPAPPPPSIPAPTTLKT